MEFADGETPMVGFEFGGEHAGGALYVYRACPKCGRFLRVAAIHVEVNGLGESRASAQCGSCGDIEPEIAGWF